VNWQFYQQRAALSWESPSVAAGRFTLNTVLRASGVFDVATAWDCRATRKIRPNPGTGVRAPGLLLNAARAGPSTGEIFAGFCVDSFFVAIQLDEY